MGALLLIVGGIVCIAIGVFVLVWGILASVWPGSSQTTQWIGLGSMLAFGALGVFLLVLA